MNATPLFIPVGPELIIIVAVLTLLFGATRIPKLARAMGQSTGSFQKGRAEVEREIEEMKNEATEVKTEIETETNQAVEDMNNEANDAVKETVGN